MSVRGLAAVALSLITVGTAAAADLRDKKAPEAEVPKEVPFFLFADTQISYRYQFPTVTPGIQIQRPDGSFRSREAPKHILNISHADAWAYGTNFFSLDILQSGSQFPAGTTNTPGGVPLTYDYGNTEAYGLYRARSASTP